MTESSFKMLGIRLKLQRPSLIHFTLKAMLSNKMEESAASVV